MKGQKSKVGVIDEVRQRIDIVELVSSYVKLDKSGRNFKAVCPFHSEKHASFYVFPERQHWHCFGSCAAGGDIFSFVMKKDNLDFAGALRLLAEKAGVSLVPPKEASAQEKEEESLRQLNELAVQFYHNLLLTSPAAQTVRDYLAKRSLSQQSINDFELGFAPESWQTMLDHLMSKGYKQEDAIKAGLAVQREGGGSYDRFRHRLMFPIRDAQGRMAGFGARALDDSMPKYLNSPQTLIFDKSGLLYGIHRARTSIRRQNLAVIVEGYVDVIIAHQHGYDNVIASMGTALSEKQVGIIKKLTKNVTLALDADAAGEVATLRGMEVTTHALEQKVVPVVGWRGGVRYEDVLDGEVRVMTLPSGKDPDEVITQEPEKWRQLAEAAKPVIDWAFEAVSAKLDLNQPKDKSACEEQLLPAIAEIKEPTRQAHYIDKLSRLIRVDARVLKSKVSALMGSPAASSRSAGGGASAKPAPKPRSNPLEAYCLGLLFRHPALRDKTEVVLAEYFEESDNRELFFAWRSAADPETCRQALDAALQERFDFLLAMPLPPASEKEHERRLFHCVLRLRERFLRGLELRKKETVLAEEELGGIAVGAAKDQEQGLEVEKQLYQVFKEQSRLHRKQP